MCFCVCAPFSMSHYCRMHTWSPWKRIEARKPVKEKAKKNRHSFHVNSFNFYPSIYAVNAPQNNSRTGSYIHFENSILSIGNSSCVIVRPMYT